MCQWTAVRRYFYNVCLEFINNSIIDFNLMWMVWWSLKSGWWRVLKKYGTNYATYLTCCIQCNHSFMYEISKLFHACTCLNPDISKQGMLSQRTVSHKFDSYFFLGCCCYYRLQCGKILICSLVLLEWTYTKQSQFTVSGLCIHSHNLESYYENCLCRNLFSVPCMKLSVFSRGINVGCFYFFFLVSIPVK